MEPRQIHVLAAPLQIATDNAAKSYYLLPAGTNLYFDRSMSEGFDRYYLYVNVEGPHLELKPESPPGMKAPLTAYPLGKEDVISLLGSYPLSRDDLIRILNSKALTRQDLVEILNSYKHP